MNEVKSSDHKHSPHTVKTVIYSPQAEAAQHRIAQRMHRRAAADAGVQPGMLRAETSSYHATRASERAHETQFETQAMRVRILRRQAMAKAGLAAYEPTPNNHAEASIAHAAVAAECDIAADIEQEAGRSGLDPDLMSYKHNPRTRKIYLHPHTAKADRELLFVILNGYATGLIRIGDVEFEWEIEVDEKTGALTLTSE